jgi:hypothetical protein
MKLLRVTLILAAALTIGLIIDSCCNGGYSYKWTYIITENLNNNEVAASTDSIAKGNYGIKIHLFNRKYAQIPTNPFINAAYAVDCEGMYTKRDSITDIEVFTINKLNSNKEALSEVTNLFCGSYYGDNTSVDELISDINLRDMDPIDEIDLKLNAPNIIDTVHQFIVKIKLTDNRIMIDTTKAIRIY